MNTTDLVSPSKQSVTNTISFKAGLGVGLPVLALLLLLLFWWWWRRRHGNRHDNHEEQDHIREQKWMPSIFPPRPNPSKIMPVPAPVEHQEYHEPEIANNPYRTGSLRTSNSGNMSAVFGNTGDPYNAAGVGRSDLNATRSSTLYENVPREEDEDFPAYAEAPSPRRQPTLPNLRVINATPPQTSTAPPSYRPTDGSTRTGATTFRIPRRSMAANRMNSVSTPLMRTEPYGGAVELPGPYRSRTPDASFPVTRPRYDGSDYD